MSECVLSGRHFRFASYGQQRARHRAFGVDDHKGAPEAPSSLSPDFYAAISHLDTERRSQSADGSDESHYQFYLRAAHRHPRRGKYLHAGRSYRFEYRPPLPQVEPRLLLQTYEPFLASQFLEPFELYEPHFHILVWNIYFYL